VSDIDLITPIERNQPDVHLPPTVRREPMDATAYAQKVGWNQEDVDQQAAWDVGANGQRTVAMIFDTGRWNHIDIPEPDDGFNATPEPDTDKQFHSTHIAGSMFAINNEIGYRGNATDAVKIYCKVLRDSGSGWSNDIEKAYAWAINWWVTHPKRPKKLGGTGEFLTCGWNLSYGGGGPSQRSAELLREAVSVGIIPFAATGNSGQNRPDFPAAYDAVHGVGAYGPGRSMASFSNQGPWMQFAAPGVKCPGTVGRNQWADWDGTSMACPNALSTCLNWVSAHPDDTWHHDFHGFLEASADYMADLPGPNDGRGVFLPADAVTRSKMYLF
jgi:subtilisin family serine protease